MQQIIFLKSCGYILQQVQKQLVPLNLEETQSFKNPNEINTNTNLVLTVLFRYGCPKEKSFRKNTINMTADDAISGINVNPVITVIPQRRQVDEWNISHHSFTKLIMGNESRPGPDKQPRDYLWQQAIHFSLRAFVICSYKDSRKCSGTQMMPSHGNPIISRS